MGSVRTLAWAMIFAGATFAAPVPTVKPAEGEVPLAAAKLLKHRKVQKELKLTAEQRIAIVDALADIDDAIAKKAEALVKLPNAADDAFQKLNKEQRKGCEKVFAASAKAIAPVQRSRLRQIDRQIRGPQALTDPGTEKLLSLTDVQKKTFAEAGKQLEEKLDVYFMKLGNDDSDNAKEELLKVRKELEKSLVAGLTADQREVWKSLLGEPVKSFDAIDLWFTLLEEDESLLP